MPLFLGYWLPFLRFGLDAQHVVAMRLGRLSATEAGVSAEATLMVTEKIAAMGESQAALVLALSRGATPGDTLEAAFAPFRRRVHANCERLAH